MIAPIVRRSVFTFVAVSGCFAQNAPNQYILILQGPPLGATFHSREVGGQNATVLFTGLAPGYPALYQINATMPQGLAAGVQPITVMIGGITSKTSHIPVQ